VIAFSGGFHGRTLLASAMTGKVAPYKKGLGPFPGEIYHLPFPSETTGVTVAETMKALSFLFAADLEPERVAAVIVEPIQGEGGFHVAPPELFRALAELRERHGILLIADEVQSGFARTGKMFGIEHSGVEPDLVCVAKSLAGGLPLSGVIGRAAIMDAVEPGGLGGTYGGSPLACAAALAVLDVIEEEGLNARADAIGAMLKARIAGWSSCRGMIRIGGLRGHGAMVAFDVLDRDGNPDGAEAKRVCARALEAGLILLSCGQHGQAIRILVPLTASDAVIEEGLDRLQRALEPAPVAVPAGTAAEDVAA
jgi:4-aminobutyrate aminotransferase/(S)-3-amino-2-methylpropionate transaminase